jgi:hypothetical protein
VPHPTWLAYSFAVVMVGVSLYCVAWLIAARRQGRQNHTDVNVSHVAMGVGMAGMLVPRLKVLPDGAWDVVFVAIALWFAWRGIRFGAARLGNRFGDAGRSHGLSHYLIHLAMALAMLYMYLAPGATTAGSSAMAAPTGTVANFVGLPLLFVLILLASAVWQLDGLSRYAPPLPRLVGAGLSLDGGSGGTPGSSEITDNSQDAAPRPSSPSGETLPSLAPRLEMGCHIAMCITMGYMLILML